MRAYASCFACLAGGLVGLLAVHFMAFNMALNDKTMHLDRTGAMWQAFVHDVLVGVPVGALCGWAVALVIKNRRQEAEDPEAPE